MSPFQELLACPRCDAKPLIQMTDSLSCKSCKNEFPLLDGIPFLFPEPSSSLGQWRERLHRVIVQYERDAEAIQEELKQPKLLEPTRQRLEHLAKSYTEQVEKLREVLSPIDITEMRANFETYMAVQTRLPQRQGLTTYYANMHRDWCWGEEENQLAAQQVISAIGDETPAKILVLGSGGSRLAYDIHQQCKPEMTVALDINPLLLLSAKRIMEGEKVELFEFPIAAKNINQQAVLRELCAPGIVNDGFHFILGDALHAPFAPGAFDLVITPWLLDIIPEDLRSFVPRINRLLSMGGRWINFGSLSFVQEKFSACYNLEEVALIASESGFQQFASSEVEMPYMQSPLSRHGRVESVITTSSRKHKKAAKPKRHTMLPDWIVKGVKPVPLLKLFQTQSMATRIHAFIMGLVDGNRSVKDMAMILEQQRLMPKEEAEPAIRSFLTKMYEENLRPPNF